MRPMLKESGLEIFNEDATFFKVQHKFLKEDTDAQTRLDTLSAQQANGSDAAGEKLARFYDAVGALYHRVKMQFAAELGMRGQGRCKSH